MHKKIASVLPNRYDFSSGLSSLGLRSASLTAAVAVLMGSGGAIAASNQAAPGSGNLPQPMQMAQSTTNPPDVEVDTSPGSSGSNSTNLNQVRFSCETAGGQYTVMYHPQSQPNQSYAWATPSAMGSAWSPQRRCQEISRRLESYRPDGLVEMRTAVENGYNTICATTDRVPECRIILTVPSGQDPQLIRDRVFQNLTVADSGQVTQGVNTFVGGRGGGGKLDGVLNDLGLSSIFGGKNSQLRSQNIYLKPFLDRADGGTSERLSRRGVVKPSNNGRRLNPRNFR